MKLFSQREGYKPARNTIQVAEVDSVLRNGLWNAFDMHYWKRGERLPWLNDPRNGDLKLLVDNLWLDYFKAPVDTISNDMSAVRKELRQYFFGCYWFEVYDFIEFIANNYCHDSTNKEFMEYCNSILERDLSGYRFVGKKITPITTKEEIAEVEEALRGTAFLDPVVIHLNTALDLFSNKKSPDYRNSIKESISAVEAICNLLAGERKKSLTDALKLITRKQKIKIHPSLLQSFIKLYGYTSDAEGIRHALLDEPNLNFEDAKFMLVSCSAFINYLKVKASKAGIDLESK